MSIKTCASCKHCTTPPTGGNINDSKCDVVEDPFTGSSLPVKIARMDNWGGLSLPCGYAGALWEAK